MELRNRREVLIGGALLALPSLARAADTNDALWMSGSSVQGGLMLGNAGKGGRAWVNGFPVRVSDGLFCFGFGPDATKPTLVRAIFADGREETKSVMPARRKFATERVSGLAQKFVTPNKEEQDRIDREADAVSEARAQDSDEIWFSEKLDVPVHGDVTGVFGSQRILNGKATEPHYGVDIAAPTGTPVLSPLSGRVTMATGLFLTGNTVILDHGHGVSTSYLHLSRMDAKVGETLKRGQPIGLVGQTGRATGPHLCWRLNWFQTRLDVALVAPQGAKGPPGMGDKI